MKFGMRILDRAIHLTVLVTMLFLLSFLTLLVLQAPPDLSQYLSDIVGPKRQLLILMFSLFLLAMLVFDYFRGDQR
jgi:hypothetical protein